jgi:hypothetical protein
MYFGENNLRCCPCGQMTGPGRDKETRTHPDEPTFCSWLCAQKWRETNYGPDRVPHSS